MSSKPLSQAAPGRNAGYALQAPSASAATPLRCPGKEEVLPRIDDHLVTPELSGLEIVRGARIEVMGANAEHGDPHCQLDHVLFAHVAPGYVASTDLQTRFTRGSDFASDTCIRRQGQNPLTQTRHLEELVFEIVNEQHLSGPSGINAKAADMASRGVRRIFAIFVKSGEIREWQQERWQVLSLGSSLNDVTLIRPLPLKALMDAAEADNAVARALLTKNNPVLQQNGAERERLGLEKGERRGLAKAVLHLLGRRGVTLSPEEQQRIATCRDEARLERWLDRALDVTTAADLFIE